MWYNIPKNLRKKMINMDIRIIPQSELEIMKVIWKNTEPVSSRTITDELEKTKGWKKTTTLTLLSRLTIKGVLNAEKKRRTYYTSNINRKDYMYKATEAFIEDKFENNIEELKEIIKEIEK